MLGDVNYCNSYNLSHIILEMCDHKKRPKLFCVFENCTQKECFGCLTCIKNTHKKCRFEQFIDQNTLVLLLQKFRSSNQTRQNQKACNLKVYKLLMRIKTQLSNKIQQAISQIMSKIKYPFLFRNQLLDSYRNIRDKNYLRLQSTKLKRFYEIGKKINEEDFAEKESLYYQQYLNETQKQLQNMLEKLQNVQKAFKFTFHQDIKALQQSCLKQIYQYLRSSKTPKKQVTHDSIQKLSVFYRSNTEGQKSKMQFLTPVKQKSLLNVSLDYLNIKSPSIEKQRKKSELSLDNQSKEILWKSPLSSREQLEKKSKIFEDEIFSQSQTLKFHNGHGLKNWFDETNNLHIKVSDISRETKRTQNTSGLEESIQFINKQVDISSKSNDSDSKRRNYQEQIKIIRNQRQQNIRRRLEDLIKEKQVNKKKDEEMKQPQDKKKQLKISIIVDQSRTQKKQNTRSPKKQFESPKKTQLKDSHKGLTNSQIRKSPKKSDNVSLNKYLVKGCQKIKQTVSNNITNMKQIPLVNQHKDQSIKRSKLLRKKSLNTVGDEIQAACLYYLKIKQIKDKQKLRQFLQSYNEKCANNLTAVEHLSFTYLQQGKAKQCLNLSNEYLQKMDLLPFNQLHKLNLIINKSASLNMLGRYSENISYIVSKLQKIEHQKLHKNIGDAYFQLNTSDKAIYHYQKAIKLNDKYDEAYYNLAVILYNQQIYFNAKMNITKALYLDSKNQFYEQLLSAINQRIKMNEQN